MKRMDRYKDEETPRVNRTTKNQELYQNVSNNAIYTNITDVTNANAFEIDNESRYNNSHATREAYHKMQKYQNVEPVGKTKKELDDFNYLYQRKENKIYDINSFLEEARKNRQEKDEKEEKRKLKNNAYNILTSMNKETLEKYREEKKKKIMTPEEEEIRDLIDTIASKTLAGEIDKATSVDLLSDLMATNIFDKVEGISSEITEENEIVEDDTEKEKTEENEIVEVTAEIISTSDIEDIKEDIEEDNDDIDLEKTTKQEIEKELKSKDSDFYTKSMDLSDKDFDVDMADDFKEKKLPIGIKILIFILILAIIAVAGYFIYKKFI